MSYSIQTEVYSRGISRLCHFTPARNLVHIASNQDGLKSIDALRSEQTACFTATDTKRLDGYTGHICCSIEYPNAWYLSKAEANEAIFKDWVILFISPHYLWNASTCYCPRNAAAGGGGQVVKSLSGFQSLFAPSVTGAYGKTNFRGAKHFTFSPTDDQAEILVEAHVPLVDILGVAVKDETQAKNEVARLRWAGIDPNPFQFVIAPQLFEKYALSSSIRAGKRPTEILFSAQS
jgi:hypothetical protein